MRPLPTLAVCLLVALGAVASHEAFVAGPRAAALEDRVADLEAAAERAPSTTPLMRKVIALEAKVDALERRGGAAGGGLDLEAVKAALAGIRAEERAARTQQHVRARLAQNGVELPAADEPAVVAIISRYTGALLAVREDPAPGGPGTRYAGARQAHARMVEELRALLPEDRAQVLIDLYPPPPAPAEPKDG